MRGNEKLAGFGGLGQRPNPGSERGIETNSGSTTGGIGGSVLPGKIDSGITSPVGEYTGSAPCWQCEPQPGWGNASREQVRLRNGLHQAKLGQRHELSRDTCREGIERGSEALPLFFAPTMPYVRRACLQGCRLLARIGSCPGVVNRQDRTKEKTWLETERNYTTLTGQPDTELDLRGVICPYNFRQNEVEAGSNGARADSFSAVGRRRSNSKCPSQRE